MHPRFPRLIFAASLSALVACEGPTGPAGNDGTNGANGTNGTAGMNGMNGMDGMAGTDGRDGRDVSVDPSLSPVEKIAAGFGGMEALVGLYAYRMEVSTRRFADGEAFTFDGRPVPSNTTTTTISVDLSGNQIREDVARSLTFFGFPNPQTYTIYIKQGTGYVDGVESAFGLPTGDLLSDGVAALLKEHDLLNPHHILQQAVIRTERTSDGGLAVLDGSLHHLVVVFDEAHPITFWVNAQTGRITKATTIENSPLLRDVELTVFYLGWQSWEDGEAAFPKQVILALGDQVLYEETRTRIEINRTWPVGHFDLPAGAMPMFDQEAAFRGAKQSEFHQGFQAIGIRIDGLQTFVMPQEVSPGVWFLGGGTHNSIAVEQQNGIVILEPPLYEERTNAILDWARTQFPTKPVTHVAITHHHHDHAGGVRAFAAAGAQIVVHESTIEFFQKVLAAPSTIIPDALAGHPVHATILGVPPDDTLTLPDAVRPVSFLGVSNTHADDMIAAYVPSAQLIFESDLFNPQLPAFPGSPFPAQLYDSLVADGFDATAVSTVAGGHGGIATFDELRIAAGR